ncbi:hypothetical protein BFJ69_g2365 [Fusarium oxysporum]|uniref:Uncharacterized protein n=1 Tax=Fusarium oxysporum TaxID=5507 RepID=A0A420NUX9_FUSOX|nr:hypothetical protein BFJ69_g2365 [Fusarium oxysporum]
MSVHRLLHPFLQTLILTPDVPRPGTDFAKFGSLFSNAITVWNKF